VEKELEVQDVSGLGSYRQKLRQQSKVKHREVKERERKENKRSEAVETNKRYS
jgi:hypothetical protein